MEEDKYYVVFGNYITGPYDSAFLARRDGTPGPEALIAIVRLPTTMVTTDG